MSERQVTVEGETRPLPDPFIVFATQNPIEYHGTYPLPEAQLDRFAMRLEVEYPSAEEEVQILLDQQREHPLVNLKTVARNQDMLAEIESAQAVAIDPALTQYITDLVRATREDARIQLGASPRAALLLHRTSRALAYIRNRDFVTPDDVKTLAVPVLAHRLVLETRTSYAGGDKQAIVSDVIETVKAPR
jgi:MoxR-like ATPase